MAKKIGCFFNIHQTTDYFLLYNNVGYLNVYEIIELSIT